MDQSANALALITIRAHLRAILDQIGGVILVVEAQGWDPVHEGSALASIMDAIAHHELEAKDTKKGGNGQA